MKILVIKSSSLGDIIHSYDLIVYLKKKFPALQLEWVVERTCAPLVGRHPYIDQVHTIDSKEWRKHPFSFLRQTSSYHKKKYDLVIDLQGNCKSALLLSRAKAKQKVGFGWASLPEWPNFFFTTHRYNPPKGRNIREDYLYLAQCHCSDFSRVEEVSPNLRLTKQEETTLQTLPKGGVIIAAFSRWPNKEVSEEKIEQVLKNIEGKRFFLAKGSERERVKKMQERMGGEILPELSLPLLQHLLAQSKLVVAVDSLVLHLAGTTKVATVSFFGPSSSKKYAPIGKQHRLIEGRCHLGICFEKRCPHLRTCPTPKCME